MKSINTAIITKLVSGKLQERETQLFYSSVSSAGVKATTVLASLITLPLILNTIGAERYGMLLAITSMAGIINFADFGLGFGLQNKLPHFLQEGDVAVRKAISSAFAFLLVSTIAILSILLLMSTLIDWSNAFHLSSNEAKQEVDESVLLFGLCFTASIPFSIIQKIQIGLQKGYYSNLWIIAGNIVSIVAVYGCYRFGASTPLLILAINGINLSFILLNFSVYFFSIKPALRPGLFLAEANIVKLILKDSILFFVVQCSAILLFVSNNFYLIHFSGPEAVTKFNIGYKLVLLLLIIVESIGPYLTPALNEAILKADFQWVRKITRQAILLSITISLAAGLAILLIGNYLLHFWIGPNITFSLIDLIAIAAFAIMFSSIGSIISYIMLTSVLIQYKIIFYTAAVFASLLVKYMWVKQYGVIGAYWSTSITMLLVYILPSLFILRRKRFL